MSAQTSLHKEGGPGAAAERRGWREKMHFLVVSTAPWPSVSHSQGELDPWCSPACSEIHPCAPRTQHTAWTESMASLSCLPLVGSSHPWPLPGVCPLFPVSSARTRPVFLITALHLPALLLWRAGEGLQHPGHQLAPHCCSNGTSFKVSAQFVFPLSHIRPS